MDLIGRYLSGGITAAEKAELMAWVEENGANRKFFDEMIQLWGMSSQYEDEPFETNVNAAWQNLETRLKDSVAAPAAGARLRRLGQTRILLRYAAAIAALLIAGYWALSRYNTAPGVQMVETRTSAGEQRELSLPDGSRVLLNENTRLAYAEPFEQRLVQLSGEAFFEVEKMNGKPFAIEAEGTTTTVLGTSFNVRAYPQEGQVEVSVSTGKVALQQTGEAENKVLLEPGESGVYSKKEATVQEVSISNADAWKAQRLRFDGASLEEVVQAVERYFHTDIEVATPELLNCHFKGDFVQPENLEVVLEAIAFTMDLQLEQKDGAYLLSGNASRCR
ncbi:MAG: FecR domain-containing protein [Lewinellaceae bacterium]|nr:FecR domain-containing protein [Lewinellaceae bacterium]